MTKNLSLKEAINLFHQYQVDGKIVAATELLKTLCDRSLVDIDLDSYERDFGTKVKPEQPEELNEVLIKVNVADKNNKCTCWIKAGKEISVQNFRSLLLDAFGFPIRLQVLYTKEDVLNDEAVLTDIIVKEDKKFYQVELFLKEGWLRKRRNEEFQSWNYAKKLLPDYEPEEEVKTHEKQPVVLEEPIKPDQNLLVQQDIQEQLVTEILLNTILDNTDTAVIPKTSGKTWICTNCTFENEDWRPGCEMCATDRE